MKPLSLKEQFDLLADLIRDWRGATASPRAARAVLFAKTFFSDGFISQFVTALLLADGDVSAALKDVDHDPRVWTEHRARLSKLKTWIAGLQKREVRGLLEWKGGAV